MPERSNEPTVIPAPLSAESKARSEPDRREQRRFLFSAAAEVIDVLSNARVTGRCSDLSLGGCYVDTLSPLATGTTVRIGIERESRVLEAKGIVVYEQLQMGMGLAFTEIQPRHKAILRSWIEELSGEPVAEIPSPSQREEAVQEAVPVSEAENLRQVLNDLINLLVRRKLISEEERTGLLRQIFR